MTEAMDDALNIRLTEADFAEMDVKQLVTIHEKLRQSREDMKHERDQMKEKLDGERDALQRMINLAQHMKQQAQERDARLARVAMRLIDQGALDRVVMPEANDAG